MISLDAIARVLKAEPRWDPATGQARLRQGDRELRFQTGSARAQVNGADHPLPMAPLEQNGEPFVPLRFAAESLGASVTWEASAQTVRVQTSATLAWTAMTAEDKSWWEPTGHPEPYSGSFWAPDTARELPPVAYGTLGYHSNLPIGATIRSYVLQSPLPNVKESLPVYIQGSYPQEFRTHFARAVEEPQDWYVVPEYALFTSRDETAIGEKAPVGSPEEAEQRAAQLLGPLLEGEYRTAPRQRDDGWDVIFHRVANGVRMVGRPLTVHLNGDGQATFIGGRRRPLLAWSAYPTLPPEEAWRQVQAGRWLALYIDEPQLEGVVDAFTVTEVELIYHEQHADFPLQVMPPYYAFRNKEGYALYVPAVADPHTTRP